MSQRRGAKGAIVLGDLGTGRGALRPKARLLRTLGNDLISSDKVALIELVKNSYDADATTVLIRFHGPLDKGAGRIDVWDDGHGMDVGTLASSWLDIATDTKKKRKHSEGGRRVLGEKGIGRLAAARIGHELLLVTRRQTSDEVALLIDWTQFDRDEAYLDEIEIGWQIDKPDVFAEGGQAQRAFSSAAIDQPRIGHGTVLQIGKLTRNWSTGEIAELRTALARLVRPRPLARDVAADFEIHLDLVSVPATLQQFSGLVDASTGFQEPQYRISGIVDSTGRSSFTYTQLKPAVTETIAQHSLWDNTNRDPEVGPFEFEINVWDRDTTTLRRTLTATANDPVEVSTKSLKGFRSELDELAGVSVYRDGFRVLPFGERGDDWLGLDLRRVQSPTRRLSNNQVIGHIFITADGNPALRDQSNREGILEGTAYADLQRLVRAALTILENKRYLARRPPQDAPGSKSAIFDPFDLTEIRGALVDSYPRDTRVLELIDAKTADIREGVTDLQNVLSRYSRLATLGSLIDRVVHDGRTVVTRLKNISRFGERDLRSETKRCEDKIAIATTAIREAGFQAAQLSSLFNQIEPFGGRRRGRPKDVPVKNVFLSAVSMLEAESTERGVQLLVGGEDLTVRLDQAELLTVVVNLMQNAIYWTGTVPESADRFVMVEADRRNESSVTIVVSDSGPGVPHDVRDVIFDPYFSTRPDGYGLGLSIAGTIVEDLYDGELVLVDSGPLGGATFEATFRRRL